MTLQRCRITRTVLVGASLGIALAVCGFLIGNCVIAEPPKASVSSGIKGYAVRLTPGQDLKKELLAFARKEGLKAPAIVTCVGSLTDVSVRLANQKEGTTRKGYFEIVALVGLLDPAGGHIHLCVTDKDGVAFGGHLMDGSLVYTTAEVVIAELSDLEFKREEDKTFGYKELVVYPRSNP
jgi:predicted DNA-binding protein with PD1-like motif